MTSTLASSGGGVDLNAGLWTILIGGVIPGRGLESPAATASELTSAAAAAEFELGAKSCVEGRKIGSPM